MTMAMKTDDSTVDPTFDPAKHVDHLMNPNDEALHLRENNSRLPSCLYVMVRTPQYIQGRTTEERIKIVRIAFELYYDDLMLANDHKRRRIKGGSRQQTKA